MNEAILLFEESHEGHKIEQLPQLSIFEENMFLRACPLSAPNQLMMHHG
jgi:hypothetical protein